MEQKNQTTDEQQRAQGKEIKFGLRQVNNPTPTIAKVVFRTILYLSALWAVLMPMVTEIPEVTIALINKWMIIGNAIINVTIKFFGWDFSN